MNNSIVIGAIILVSLLLGYIKYRSIRNLYKMEPLEAKFIEVWNSSTSFLISGLIGYYFILIRLPMLLKAEDLKVSDLILFIIFILGLFGHLPVMSNNITNSIQAIFKKLFK